MQECGVIWTTDEEVLQHKRIIDNNFLPKMKDLNDESAIGTNFSRPQIPI